SELELRPDRRMIRGFFHPADSVIDTGIDAVFDQPLAGHDQVYTQPASGVVFETATTVVKPAETIGDGRIHMTEGVDQPPVLELLQPFTLFGQEAALAGAQPALGIGFPDTDITVL